MSRPASLLRTALRPAARPALPLPRPLLTGRATYSTRKQKRNVAVQLPPEAAFEEASQKAGFKEANPNLYYRCVSEWQGALKRGQTDDMDLLKRINATPQDFHEAAIFYLQFVPPIPGTHAGPRRALALSMLNHASEHGNDAATLTYLNNELEHSAMGLKTAAPISGPILTRLDAIASTNRSPDAITLQGRLALRKDDHKAAEILFRRATELGRSDPSLPFTWRASCLVYLGQSLRRQGDVEGARACFLEAAERHNLTRAWLELTYDGECPEEVERSAVAAMRGNAEECVRISGAESEMAVKALERGDKGRFMDHQYASQEWLKLANTKTAEDLGKIG